jgi:hypothetical protein
MRNRRILILASFSVALFTGCVSYPLGLSKSEWEAMSPKKQAEYRALQNIKDGYSAHDNQQVRQAVDAQAKQIEDRNRWQATGP